VNPLLQPLLKRSSSSETAARWSHRIFCGLMGGAWLLLVVREWGVADGGSLSGWPEIMLLFTALLVTVSTLARQISLQSALMAAILVGMIGGIAHWISYVSDVPFGPLRFPQANGTSPFQEWFFVPMLLWMIALLNARGVARLILIPFPRHAQPGLLLLGGSIVLIVLFAMALEPFASVAHRYWLWGGTRLPVTWQGTPLSSLVAWGVVGIIASLAATSFLIPKHPVPPAPALEPAWIWAMANSLFAVGTATAGLWWAAAVGMLNTAIALAALGFGLQRRSTNRIA
jgi:hypothetical protein